MICRLNILIIFTISLSSIYSLNKDFIDVLSFSTNFINSLTRSNITQCLPDQWVSYTGANTNQSQIFVSPFNKTNTSEIQKVLEYIGDGVDDVCEIGGDLMKILGINSNSDDAVVELATSLENAKSYQIIFENIVQKIKSDQENATLRNLFQERNLESFDSIFHKIANELKKAGHNFQGDVGHIKQDISVKYDELLIVFSKLSKDAKKAKNLIEKRMNKVESFIKKGLINDLEKIVNIVKNLVKDAKNFYSSPIVYNVIKNIKSLEICVMSDFAKISKGIAELIAAFEKKLLLIETGIGIVDVAVGLICNYSSFIPAIEALISGIHSQGQKKFVDLGVFLGSFILALSTS